MSAFQKMEPQAGGPALVGCIEAVKMDPLFFELEIYPVRIVREEGGSLLKSQRVPSLPMVL